MSCRKFSATTAFHKIATIVLFLAIILLIAGTSSPRWSTLTLSEMEYGTGYDESYYAGLEENNHAGLWMDCSCMGASGSQSCFCSDKFQIREWLRAVQAMIILGLIGLVISAILSVMILFKRQDKEVKRINIVMVVCAGVFIVSGVMVFGIENAVNFEEVFDFIDLTFYGSTTHGSLSASFYLAAIAGALCLLVCLPLYLKDYLTPIQSPVHQIIPIPLQYTNHGQVMSPPPGQTQVALHTSVQQQGVHMQSAVYVQPGQLEQD